MDLVKIGKNLQILRKEKGLTQEQIAEKYNVSRRTVSRWETGTNIPDLDILISLSDFYGVDLRKLLDGERTYGKMDNETKETILKIAEYSIEEKTIYTKTSRLLLFITWIILLIMLVFAILNVTGVSHINNDLFSYAEFGSFILILISFIFFTKEYKRIKESLHRIRSEITDQI